MRYNGDKGDDPILSLAVTLTESLSRANSFLGPCAWGARGVPPETSPPLSVGGDLWEVIVTRSAPLRLVWDSRTCVRAM